MFYAWNHYRHILILVVVIYECNDIAKSVISGIIHHDPCLNYIIFYGLKTIF